MKRGERNRKAFLYAVLAVIAIVFISVFVIPLFSNYSFSPGSSTCEDFDGGVEPSIAGVLKRVNRDGSITIKTDSCSGNKVKEYYCQGNQWRSQTLSCAEGCQYSTPNFEDKEYSVGGCKQESEYCGYDRNRLAIVEIRGDYYDSIEVHRDRCNEERQLVTYSCNGRAAVAKIDNCLPYGCGVDPEDGNAKCMQGSNGVFRE